MDTLIFRYSDGLYFCRDTNGKFYRGNRHQDAVRFTKSSPSVTPETTAWFNFHLAGFDGDFYKSPN